MTANTADEIYTRRSIAYLVSEYPSLSHVFIEREIRALRKSGVSVATFSVRRIPQSIQVSDSSQIEADSTISLQDRKAHSLAAIIVSQILRRPRSAIHGLYVALRSGPRTLRQKTWQMFYWIEAMILLDEMKRRGLTHIHVHFAINSADIARLTVAMANFDNREPNWHWTLSMHGPTEFDDPIRYDLEAKYRSAAGIACISQYCRDLVEKIAGPEAKALLGIVRMTVDISRYNAFAEDRSKRRAGKTRVLFVGRLVPEKGPIDLVNAINGMQQDGYDVELKIAGTGPLLREIAEAVDLLGRSPSSIELVGPVGQEDVVRLYEWADIFCLPSYAEGLPVVLMEAMASELPVVTTAIAGIPELVTDGATGVLVEPGDVTAISRALMRLADEPELRRQYGEAGRDVVLREFSERVNSTRLLSLFREVEHAIQNV